MPLQATSGAASYDGFGGGVAAVPQYIEDVFSTYLYAGTGAAQTITNSIDLSTKGGLVWVKSRNWDYSHYLTDTVKGPYSQLRTNVTNGEDVDTQRVTSFLTTGFTLGTSAVVNNSAYNYASWTFRKQPKFFDVVTWTGSNDSGTNIGKGIVSHNLGSAPGCVIVKNATSGSTNWIVYHRSLSGGYRVLLNTTDAQTNTGSVGYFSKYTDGVGWAQTNPDANNIYVGYNYQTNDNGATMVAYLFAHDAGGFGATATDNVISCGSFTTDGAGTATVTLGYEPQWVLAKKYSSTGSWFLLDTMRGWINDAATGASGQDKYLLANSSSAEGNYQFGEPNSTGFRIKEDASSDYIYIAIRRGPMKVPTTGTSVFQPVTYTGNGTSQSVTTGITGDLTYIKYRTDAGAATIFTDRLRGSSKFLESNSTAAEDTSAQHLTAFNQLGFSVGNNGNVNASGGTFISETFKRAPSFFDEVCYTGTGDSTAQTHNLGVPPELVICKSRSSATYPAWGVWSAGNGVVNNDISGLSLNSTAAAAYINLGYSSRFTATTFRPDTVYDSTENSKNQSGQTYVAYLFATCAGVSKVGSYTGTATTQTINCGFTSGARFVLIKRTDSTGDWYVWDSARGIVAGNDSYLLLNSTAAEVTSTDYIDTYSAGFEISSTAPAAINANGGTYIFLAIA